MLSFPPFFDIPIRPIRRKFGKNRGPVEVIFDQMIKIW